MNDYADDLEDNPGKGIYIGLPLSMALWGIVFMSIWAVLHYV